MRTPELELVSFALCPYVQRSVITLLHKKAEYWTTYIDLARPPDWFRALSPLGKVPVLLVREEGQEERVVLFDLFSLVDAAFAPFFFRLFLLDPLRESAAWARLPRTRKWAERLIALPEVQDSVPADFAALYLDSLRQHGNQYARDVA